MAKATKKEVGKHSSPLTAGKQNLSKEYVARNKEKEDGNNMGAMMHLLDKGRENTQEYKGLWSDEELAESIYQFFSYCADTGLKPAKAGLRLWLGLSKSQWWKWENDKVEEGHKARLLEEASNFMELQYLDRGEAFPTFNMFLLKAGHNYIDKQTLEVNTHNEISKDEISDVVNKLGLDK